MNKVRCNQCGLVNWDTAAACLRCKSSLDLASPAVSSTITPAERSGGGSSVGKAAALVAVLGIVGFGAYMFMMPATPPHAAAQTATSSAPASPATAQQPGAPVAIDPQKVQQLMQEDLKKADQRTAQIRAASNTWGNGLDKETMKKLAAQSANRFVPKPDHLPNPYRKP